MLILRPNKLIKALIFSAILALNCTFTLKSLPPLDFHELKDEGPLSEGYFQLKRIVGNTEFQSIIFFSKKIQSLVHEIIELKTGRVKKTLSTNALGKEDWCFQLIRHLGLGHYFGLINDDKSRILPILLKLFPMAFLEGCVRLQMQDWEKVRALTQYTKMLKRIRNIFSQALNLCRPVDGLNSFVDSMLSCCPSLQKGATGLLAQNLRKFLPSEIVGEIGMTFKFMVDECDRQFDYIFKNYDSTVPNGIYEKRPTSATLRKIAENYQAFWIFTVPSGEFS